MSFSSDRGKAGPESEFACVKAVPMDLRQFRVI